MLSIDLIIINLILNLLLLSLWCYLLSIRLKMLRIFSSLLAEIVNFASTTALPIVLFATNKFNRSSMPSGNLAVHFCIVENGVTGSVNDP